MSSQQQHDRKRLAAYCGRRQQLLLAEVHRGTLQFCYLLKKKWEERKYTLGNDEKLLGVWKNIWNCFCPSLFARADISFLLQHQQHQTSVGLITPADLPQVAWVKALQRSIFILLDLSSAFDTIDHALRLPSSSSSSLLFIHLLIPQPLPLSTNSPAVKAGLHWPVQVVLI